MKQLLWYMTTTLALVLAQKVLYANCSSECLKDNYIIVDKNGVRIECLPCHKCVIGRGLSPPCGSKLTEPQKDDIKCNPCKPGETYSDDHGPSSCKSCQICPVTLKKCTTESNTKCSKDCDKGKYYDNSTYNCQPCSHCCRADNKRISECVAHGLPPQSQCSIHDSLECSPKTTKNPTRFDKDPTVNKDSKDITVVVVVVVVALLVIVIVIIVLCWLQSLKHRRQRSGNSPEEGQLDNMIPNNCGIKKSSFTIIGPHQTDAIKEGDKVVLICKDHGNPEENHCLRHYDFKWTKDMNNCNHNGESFELNPVKVVHFGNYTCQVRCRQHRDKVPPVDVTGFELDVIPGEGICYKKFNKIESVEIYEDIANMLNSTTGIGNWKRVAQKYGMRLLDIKTLDNNGEKGNGVIDYLLSSKTNLTVYDFCKFMKTIKQNQIVDLLENHLTCTCDEERKPLDARDSGYGPESYGAQALPLSDVTHARNNIALISSREGSQDEIEDKLPANEKNNRKYQRQASNQSVKSSGSGSGSATSSMLRAAQGIVRQISQNSYKKHENENEVLT